MNTYVVISKTLVISILNKILVWKTETDLPDLRGPAHDILRDDSLDEDGLDPVEGAEVHVHVGEGLLPPAPPGHRVQTDVPRNKDRVVEAH